MGAALRLPPASSPATGRLDAQGEGVRDILHQPPPVVSAQDADLVSPGPQALGGEEGELAGGGARREDRGAEGGAHPLRLERELDLAGVAVLPLDRDRQGFRSPALAGPLAQAPGVLGEREVEGIVPEPDGKELVSPALYGEVLLVVLVARESESERVGTSRGQNELEAPVLPRREILPDAGRDPFPCLEVENPPLHHGVKPDHVLARLPPVLGEAGGKQEEGEDQRDEPHRSIVEGGF